MNNTEQYQAYLVRFQRHDTQTPWRVMLQNAQTGEKLRFGSEREAFLYLAQMLDKPPPDQPPPRLSV